MARCEYMLCECECMATYENIPYQYEGQVGRVRSAPCANTRQQVSTSHMCWCKWKVCVVSRLHCWQGAAGHRSTAAGEPSVAAWHHHWHHQAGEGKNELAAPAFVHSSNHDGMMKHFRAKAAQGRRRACALTVPFRSGRVPGTPQRSAPCSHLGRVQ